MWRCFQASTLVTQKKNLKISKLFAVSKFQVLLPNIAPRLWVTWFTTLIRWAYSIYEHLNNYGFITFLISLRPIKGRQHRSSNFCTFHSYRLYLRFVNPSIPPRITYAINDKSRTGLPYGVLLYAIFYSMHLSFRFHLSPVKVSEPLYSFDFYESEHRTDTISLMYHVWRHISTMDPGNCAVPTDFYINFWPTRKALLCTNKLRSRRFS